MTGFNEMGRHLDRAEEVLNAAESRLGNFEALRPVLAEIVGRAETADGNVVAEWNAQGLCGLDIDPRAMRMPSADLALAIREAVGLAMADMRERTRLALEEAGVAMPQRPSVEETRAQLEQVRDTVRETARRTAEGMDDAHTWRRGGGAR